MTNDEVRNASDIALAKMERPARLGALSVGQRVMVIVKHIQGVHKRLYAEERNGVIVSITKACTRIRFIARYNGDLEAVTPFRCVSGELVRARKYDRDEVEMKVVEVDKDLWNSYSDMQAWFIV